MFKSMRKAMASSVLAGVALCGQAVAESGQMNFGIISTESSQNLKTLWEPLLKDMGEVLNMKVNAYFAPDYAGIIQAMRFDKIDMAWYGNKSAMEAVDRAGGEVFAQTTAADGSPGYWSLLITQKDSPLASAEDMLAKAGELTFGNGDPNSTSGFLVPGYYVFAKNHVQPNQIFKRTLNASHEVNALAVANGQVDVATNNTESMARLKETHPDKAEKIKVIWTSPLIPGDPIVWRKNLPQESKDRVREFFLNYGKNEHERAVLAGLSLGQFRASSNDQLLPIRQLELFKERSLVQVDKTMSEAQKQARIKEIDASLGQLSDRMAAIEKKVAAVAG